jgi:hypothetical protein
LQVGQPASVSQFVRRFHLAREAESAGFKAIVSRVKSCFFRVTSLYRLRICQGSRHDPVGSLRGIRPIVYDSQRVQILYGIDWRNPFAVQQVEGDVARDAEKRPKPQGLTPF